MIRQYFAHRCRGGSNPLRVGVIASGSIYYVQEASYFRPCGTAAICRNPWIIEGFLNGAVGAARRNHRTGSWEEAYYSGRSDIALVRSLRDGRRLQVAVRTLIVHDDHGLAKQPTRHPSLPDMHLYRRRIAPALGLEHVA